MKLNELLNIKARSNPDSLLKLLVSVAVTSMLVVVILSGLSFHTIFSGFVIKNAESNSVQLCKVLIEQQKDLIFVKAPEKAMELGLHGTEILNFDLSLRHYMEPFNIIKIKVYNPEKRILYCTDPMLIGKVDEGNKRLKKALAGHVDTKMVTKEKAHDLADEELLNVDVVETYVPIITPDKRVLGAFEIYINITPYRDKIHRGVTFMTLLLALVLSGVFGFSYLLVEGGTTQLKEAQSQLEVIAITDPLTGIHNRGYLMKRGEEEFDRVCRSQDELKKSLGCIMLDIDYFKQVNDTKGHPAGDMVLKGLADRLRTGVRPYDIIGRYGGEEFMVLLPDTDFEQSLVVANRMCEIIHSNPFKVAEEFLPITVSLGVSGNLKTDSCLNDIIKRADEGLYKAKAEGRDRVAWVGQA